MLVMVLALVLASAMMLAACQGDAPAPAPGSAIDAPAGHNPRAFQPVPEGPWNTPYELPVHVTAVASHASNWHYEDGDDIHNNPWIRLYQDELNIHVTWDWVVIDNYDHRLNMTVAAGMLPDVFMIDRTTPLLFNQLQEAGMLLDLTDAYNAYTSERVRSAELADPLTIQGYTVDGRIYGIPRYYYGQIDQPWHLWVRKDWYEAAGSPEIRTVEDFENLAHHFMSEYGGYGLSVHRELQWLFRTAPMFDAYVGNIFNNQYFWMPDETGRIKPGIAFPEFLTALEYWQRWFAEGIISPDFVTMDEQRAGEDIVNGRVGIQCWWQWWGWMWGMNTVAMQQNDDAYFIPLNLPTVAGDRPAKGQIFYPNMGVIAASADFQNPAALMKILSILDHMVYSPDANLTPEELHYYMADGREHAMTGTFSRIDPLTDMIQFQHVNHALQTGDTSQLFTTGMQMKYNDSVMWINDKNPTGLGSYLQQGFPESAYGRSQHLFDNGWVITTALWGPEPVEFSEAGSTGDIIIEEVMQIIMGNKPVSHFEIVLEQWYAQGGQIKEDAVNKLYGGN